MESISSMKIIAGEFFSASSKAFLRLPSASPAILDMISGPLIKKKNAPVSLATALAINVLPDPIFIILALLLLYNKSNTWWTKEQHTSWWLHTQCLEQCWMSEWQFNHF